MPQVENLYSSAVNAFRPDVSLRDIEMDSSQEERDFHFVMRCNGYFQGKDGYWHFSHESMRPFIEEFGAQTVTFFGSNPSGDRFFSAAEAGIWLLEGTLRQEPVLSAVRKYRLADENQAARIAFMFGGMVRQLLPQDAWASEVIRDAVGFTARKSLLGDRQSGDSLTSAVVMYALSGGPLGEDKSFDGKLFRMAEAVSEDPIIPLETENLGLSQVVRLNLYQNGPLGIGNQQMYEVLDLQRRFDDFPTVGAEFHLPPEITDRNPDFWQRVALVNMSQYQQGSYIQFSRNDRGVVEVRMNPSTYPITAANWKHYKLLLPELDEAFFTARRGKFWRCLPWTDGESTSGRL